MARAVAVRAEHTRPRLRNGVMLSFDPVRECDVVLCDEGVIVADAMAMAVLRLCDGVSSVAEITRRLASGPDGVRDTEVTAVLDRFADRRIVEWI